MKNSAPAANTSGQGSGDTKPTANKCAAQAKGAEKLRQTSQKNCPENRHKNSWPRNGQQHLISQKNLHRKQQNAKHKLQQKHNKTTKQTTE